MACVAQLPCILNGSLYQGELQHKRTAESFLEGVGELLMLKRIRSAIDTFPVLSSKASSKAPSQPASQPPKRELHLNTADQCLPSSSDYLPDLTNVDLDYLQYCLQNEAKSAANALYLVQVQRDIDAHKRLVLVDWLIEVVDEFKLAQETLFLAVSLLDRFLSAEHVPRAQLQLAGVVCLWVAAKYEEVYPPVLADFVEITDNSYGAPDLIAMEGRILRALRFQLSTPTAVTFLNQYLAQAAPEAAGFSGGGCGGGSSNSSSSGCAGAAAALRYQGPLALGGGGSYQQQRRLAHLAEYLLELSLLTPDALRYRPSVVAACALELAGVMLGGGGGSGWAAGKQQQLAHGGAGVAAAGVAALVNASAEGVHVSACSDELERMHQWASSTLKPPAVHAKYASRQRSQVASLRSSDMGGWFAW